MKSKHVLIVVSTLVFKRTICISQPFLTLVWLCSSKSSISGSLSSRLKWKTISTFLNTKTVLCSKHSPSTSLTLIWLTSCTLLIQEICFFLLKTWPLSWYSSRSPWTFSSTSLLDLLLGESLSKWEREWMNRLLPKKLETTILMLSTTLSYVNLSNLRLLCLSKLTLSLDSTLKVALNLLTLLSLVTHWLLVLSSVCSQTCLKSKSRWTTLLITSVDSHLRALQVSVTGLVLWSSFHSSVSLWTWL